MFDLDEINLAPSTSGRSTQTQEGHAMSTAKKIAKGGTFFCNRIKAEVGTRNCKSKYHYAKAQGLTMSPCLECAKVLAMIRNDPTPVEPQSTIDPKELAAMTRPAKKGTPDPIQQEATAEPKLEIVESRARVTSSVVAHETPARDTQNPFAGWMKFSPRDQIKHGDVYARIGKTSMSFSAAAAAELNLTIYDSVDVYHAGGKLGLHFRTGKKDGTFALTKEPRSKAVRKMSCASLVKSLKLDEIGAMDRRLSLREIGPGMIEIDLKKEVAA